MKKKYRVTVSIEERVVSSQVLEVTARSPEEASEICGEDRDAWRNSRSSDRVRIIQPEDAVDVDTLDLSYSVEQVQRQRKPRTPVDPEAKARVRREKSRPEERFIYDCGALRVVEVVSRDDAGNLVFSDGGVVGPAEAARSKFSASPLDALYRAREQFLQSEYQAMVDLGCVVGGVERDRALDHLTRVRDHLDAIGRAIDAHRGQ